MKKSTTRRSFLQGLAATAGFLFLSKKSTAMNAEKTFIHHVYFWLNRPDSVEDRDAMIAGLKKLSKVSTIASHHIGLPAPTRREVIDSSYAVSWCCFFRTGADQDSYQTDPIHLDFVKNCSHLWKKVVVYDSIDI